MEEEREKPDVFFQNPPIFKIEEPGKTTYTKNTENYVLFKLM
jgi:hypothetical protein